MDDPAVPRPAPTLGQTLKDMIVERLVDGLYAFIPLTVLTMTGVALTIVWLLLSRWPFWAALIP